MFGEKEHFFTCPFCFSPISMVLEQFYGEQSYIEDCQVCCSPIEIRFKFDDEMCLIFFECKQSF